MLYLSNQNKLVELKGNLKEIVLHSHVKIDPADERIKFYLPEKLTILTDREEDWEYILETNLDFSKVK